MHIIDEAHTFMYDACKSHVHLSCAFLMKKCSATLSKCSRTLHYFVDAFAFNYIHLNATRIFDNISTHRCSACWFYVFGSASIRHPYCHTIYIWIRGTKPKRNRQKFIRLFWYPLGFVVVAVSVVLQFEKGKKFLQRPTDMHVKIYFTHLRHGFSLTVNWSSGSDI